MQAVGTLRAEEAQGRLETRLGGTLSRARWLVAHTLVVLAELVATVVGSSLELGLTAALSLGHSAEIGRSLDAGLAATPVMALAVTTAVAVVLVAVGFVAFRRRGIPQG